jgi:biopolymer transport protein ExbD
MSFGGFNQQHGHAPMSEINTTPLVDVMLVLLIIFIITAPILTHSIRVDLPKAGSSASPQKPDIVTLSLNQEGKLFWNEVPVSDDELAARLSQASERKPQPELHLRADSQTRYQKIAEIMAAAQKAGIQKLGFVSQPVAASNP